MTVRVLCVPTVTLSPMPTSVVKLVPVPTTVVEPFVMETVPDMLNDATVMLTPDAVVVKFELTVRCVSSVTAVTILSWPLTVTLSPTVTSVVKVVPLPVMVADPLVIETVPEAVNEKVPEAFREFTVMVWLDAVVVKFELAVRCVSSVISVTVLLCPLIVTWSPRLT